MFGIEDLSVPHLPHLEDSGGIEADFDTIASPWKGFLPCNQPPLGRTYRSG